MRTLQLLSEGRVGSTAYHVLVLAVSPQYAQARAHVMGYYKCQVIAFRTIGAEPAPARARLANAAPTRTAAAATMVVFAQVPRRRPA
jgi:hypothetical protein